MGISSMDHASASRDESAVARNISALGWGKAMIGIAAVMLIPDSADAQPASSSDDLPQVRVTAPKRQAKRHVTRRAPARATPAPVAAAPSNVQVSPTRWRMDMVSRDIKRRRRLELRVSECRCATRRRQ
jgi:hypothetical protein